jgi:hypothetical protein
MELRSFGYCVAFPLADMSASGKAPTCRSSPKEWLRRGKVGASGGGIDFSGKRAAIEEGLDFADFGDDFFVGY